MIYSCGLILGHNACAVYRRGQLPSSYLSTAAKLRCQLARRRGLDVDAWCRVRGECRVLNEWMKRGTTTLFIERELGEALKRTDLPEGFGPQDLRWRWTALRLILPTGLFRLKDAQGEWDVFCVTLVTLIL